MANFSDLFRILNACICHKELVSFFIVEDKTSKFLNNSCGANTSVFANLVPFKCLVASRTDLWRKSLTYYSVCLKTHPKAATGKGRILSRAEDHQSALGSHSLWSFKLNIQSYSLRVWYVILLCLVSDCELAWCSVRNFPATWVYIWPGCHFIEKKDIKINWVVEAHILQLMLLMQVAIYTLLSLWY